MITGEKRTFALALPDVGVDKDVDFIYVDGIGYVADRNVCGGVSYSSLERLGYVTGKEIDLYGERFVCRICIVIHAYMGIKVTMATSLSRVSTQSF